MKFNKLFKNFGKKQDEKTLEGYLIDAICEYENADYKEAAKHFKLITQAFPDHPLAFLFLARSYIELKLYENAIDALFCHLNVDPTSVEALIYLGLTYYECGEMEQATERYQQALSLRNESVLVRENLAITRLATGELNVALDDLVALHEERPDDLNIVELLVLTLGKLGKWEAAKQYVNKLKNNGLAVDLE